MNPPLTSEEVRILGALIEKEYTTPEYYPLSLNAVGNACNQKTNRDPVVNYEERRVNQVLRMLSERNFVRSTMPSDSRVFKYAQTFTSALALKRAQSAVMCVLMLRGAQTPGEIKGRTGRIHEFETTDEVEQTLQSLMVTDPWPLVTRMPRRPGTREDRYAHLLSGEPNIEQIERSVETVKIQNDSDLVTRVERLEAEVERLSRTIAELLKSLH